MYTNEDFEIENGVLTKYYGSEKDIVIPNNVTTIKEGAFFNYINLTSITIGKGLKEIECDAFEDCHKLSNITINKNNPYYTSINNILYDKDMEKIIYVPRTIEGSINIPNKVIEIVDNAFRDCEHLKNITIPSSVTTIGFRAFDKCKSLESITIPDSVTFIDNAAFASCESLKDIKIPDGVTVLSRAIFSECKNLTNVTLSKNITDIKSFCFYNCYNLKNITIPSSVTSIESLAFKNCENLCNITVDENNPKFTSIDGVLYDKEVKTLIFVPDGIEDSVVIPSSVTSIEKMAFNCCKKLNNIILSEDNTNFSFLDGVLYDNNEKKIITALYNLKESVTISDGVTSIEEDTFSYCTNLKSITLPDSITTIGECAFKKCTNLKNIIIPDSVTTIKKGAFNGCESLESIILPPNITTIEGGIFIGGAFENCKRLENIVIPSSVTNINSYAFKGCTSLKNINIPDSVTFIGENAFYGCTSLSNIIIGKGLKTIEDEAFKDCKSLSNISIDESNPYFSSIDGALYDKDAKTLILVPVTTKDSFIIPSSVTTIEPEVFSNCQNLDSINVDENNPNFTSIDGALYDKDAKTLLLIPCAVKELNIPKSVIDFGNTFFYYCKNLNNITVDENNPNFSSLDGILYDKDMDEILFVPQKIKGSITIADTVIEIDPEIFEDCEDLECLIIPKHLKDYFEDFDQCKVVIK